MRSKPIILRLLLPALAVGAAAPAGALQAPPMRPAEVMQNEVMEEVTRVRERLIREEAGNFADLWIEHRPRWQVVFAFKRDPEATLRRYTTNPRFVARKVAYSTAELEAAREEALEALGRLDVPLSTIDVDEVQNRVAITTRLYQPEVDALLTSGRLRLPPSVKLTGQTPLGRPAVTPQAAKFVRIFPQSPYRTGVSTLELGYGSIVLRNGCLRFDRPHAGDPFVYFSAETGLMVGKDGKLAFYDRVTGEPKARVGERLALSGGAGRGTITDPKIVGPIHAACGPGPVTYGGNFESAARFEARIRR